MAMISTFAKTAEGLLRHLPERTSDIIARRFGLSGSEPETLQSIGDSFNVTRERVRQIEANGLKTLREHQDDVAEAVDQLRELFEQYGGMLGRTQLIEHTADGDEHAAAPALFLLTVSDAFDELRENNAFESRWVTDRDADKRAQNVVAALTEYLQAKKTPVAWEELEDVVGDDLPDRALHAIIHACKTIAENVFGQFGLSSWPEVSPRGVKDRAFLVLARHGSPLHFTDIADHINEAGFDSRKAHVQTVHNELIKDNRFVLVGRGLYAIKDWGYPEGTVKDVIAKTLSQSDRPMERDDIVEAVLAQRHVQRNTVLLNLHNNDEFSRLEDGRYALAQHVEEA